MTSMRTTLSGIAFLLASGSVLAQATGDPVRGKALFDNTPGASGIGTIVRSCPDCHLTVADRRVRIAETSGLDWGAFADIDLDTALTRFAQAVQSQSQAGMGQYQVLSDQQKRDIAAYLGDTPETTPENDSQLSFTATAINTISMAQPVVLKHAIATTTNLQVVSVQVAGTEAGNFSVTQQCVGPLTPGSQCIASVTYSPRNANASTPDLVFTLRQGTSGDFERVLRLSGSVAGTTPPPASGEDSGGGALGSTWLAGLVFAIGLLARRRT
jgi:cytochrome c553